MRAALIAVLASGIAALPAGIARARGGPPLDEVTLENGTFLRGTIVERTEDQITLLLPTGAVRTYPMSEVRSAEARREPVAPPAPRYTTQLRVWPNMPGLEADAILIAPSARD